MIAPARCITPPRPTSHTRVRVIRRAQMESSPPIELGESDLEPVVPVAAVPIAPPRPDTSVRRPTPRRPQLESAPAIEIGEADLEIVVEKPASPGVRTESSGVCKNDDERVWSVGRGGAVRGSIRLGSPELRRPLLDPSAPQAGGAKR
jgi:hypothetical protein